MIRRNVFAALALASTAGHAASLCRADETPLFACPIAARQVAICGRDGRAVYRFGRPGRIELEASGLGVAGTAFSGGGETQISFTRGAVRYIVYDRTVRTTFGPDGRHDPQQSAGLAVRRDGRTLSDRACRLPAAIDPAAAAKVLPSVAFVRH